MGFFSWCTQDTNQPISNIYSSRGALPCAMIDPRTWTIYEETSYDGYGVFGGKDYFELLAELNGMSNRDEGIDLEGKEGTISPILVSLEGSKDEGVKRFLGKAPMVDPHQGFFYGDDDDDDDDYDDDYYVDDDYDDDEDGDNYNYDYDDGYDDDEDDGYDDDGYGR